MEKRVDTRWLPPPEPMERVLDALEMLAPEDHILLLIHREPYPLYDILRAWGYRYDTRMCDDGSYEILISHRQEGAE